MIAERRTIQNRFEILEPETGESCGIYDGEGLKTVAYEVFCASVETVKEALKVISKHGYRIRTFEV